MFGGDFAMFYESQFDGIEWLLESRVKDQIFGDPPLILRWK